mmetsp:Transcript_5456/g.9101  ORF Transcript_5456/g.9101 Transcript_5456/m.9101 type:complete len:212 (+) Transcript_5456:730-1365(+)
MTFDCGVHHGGFALVFQETRDDEWRVGSSCFGKRRKQHQQLRDTSIIVGHRHVRVDTHAKVGCAQSSIRWQQRRTLDGIAARHQRHLQPQPHVRASETRLLQHLTSHGLGRLRERGKRVETSVGGRQILVGVPRRCAERLQAAPPAECFACFLVRAHVDLVRPHHFFVLSLLHAFQRRHAVVAHVLVVGVGDVVVVIVFIETIGITIGLII